MNMPQFERISVYPGVLHQSGQSPFDRFIKDSGNSLFNLNIMTWVVLFILIIAYPALTLAGSPQDTLAMLDSMEPIVLIFVLLSSIAVQWMIFGVNYLAIYLEGTGMAGIGLRRITSIDFAWGIAGLLAILVILAGLEVFMARIGLPVNGEVGNLIPKGVFGKVVWIMVSITAGFCEEVAFRGYLMTRLRLIGKFNSWLIPVAVSALLFGAMHSYQGLSNVIIIAVLGLTFSILYIRSGSLWPGVIAHFLFNAIQGFIVPG